jgi:hypothetical protein
LPFVFLAERLGLLDPAQPHGPGWAQLIKNKNKIKFLQKLFQKICDFLVYFLLHFD